MNLTRHGLPTRMQQCKRLTWLISLLVVIVQVCQTALALPGNTSRAVLQGRTVLASHVFSPKAKIEDASIDVTRLICELAKAYPSATELNVKVNVDVTGLEDRYGSSGDGPVEIDQIKVDDLSRIRKCSGYHELLYGDFFWLPSRLQKDLDVLRKKAENSR